MYISMTRPLAVQQAARPGGTTRRWSGIYAPHVATGAQQQLEAVGVAVLGGSVNRRSAVVGALVDVAARTNEIIYWSKRGVPKDYLLLHATLYLVLGFWRLPNVRKHESNITDGVKWSSASGACVL